MEIAKDSIDDILVDLYQYIREAGTPNVSGKGPSTDTIGVTLRLSNPRARLSRSRSRGKPFSALGELLWYLSGSDKASFIGPYHGYYTKKGKPEIVADAYGPRLRGRLPEKGFDIDQFKNTVIDKLAKNTGSRNAVVQIYDATDAKLKGDKPCTTTFQFHVREGKLHMTTTMRSNDAYIGVPHDIFCFTMLQEIVAAHLDLELGEYVHFVGSMHIYEEHNDLVTTYLKEGYHKVTQMPVMPKGDALADFDRLLDIEASIRNGEKVDPSRLDIDPYYQDLTRLLLTNFRSDDPEEMELALAGIHHREYHTYMDDRNGKKPVGKRKVK